MRIEIAKRLYEYRRAAGLSQEQVAEKVGVSRQAVSKWECAESTPDTENLIALAVLYGVTVDELLFADPEERQNKVSESVTTDEGDRAAECTSQSASADAWQPPSDPEQDHTTINFRDGIHVVDSHKGEEVHIGWDGIHVDNAKEHVHVDFAGLARMIREFRKEQE